MGKSLLTLSFGCLPFIVSAAVAPQESGPVEPARAETADASVSLPPFVSTVEDSIDSIKKGWKLVFEEEFEGTVDTDFDHSKWHIPGYRKRKEEYARLDGKGHLAVKCDYNPECASTQSTNLDSTAVWSNAKWKYGYFEARVRFTRNNGWWAAFWLFGESNANPVECGSEIDIFEDYFTRYPDKMKDPKGGIPLDHNLHAYYGPTIKSMSHESRAPGSLDDFHTIGCKWTPFEIAIYFDGRLLSRKDGSASVAFDAFRNYAFAAPLHVVLSGGPMRTWGPRDTTGFVFPEYYLVDSVRVWEYPQEGNPSVVFRKRPAGGFADEGDVLSFEAEVKARSDVRAVYLFDNGAFVAAKTNAPWTFAVPFSKAAYEGSAFMRPGRQKKAPAWEGLMHSYSLYAQDGKGRVGESAERVRIIPRPVRNSIPRADGVQQLPGQLDVSRFDEGGANVAYWSIRNKPNVRGKSLQMLHTGEWLRYTVDVGPEGAGSVAVDYTPCFSVESAVMVVVDGKTVATVRCLPHPSGKGGPKRSSVAFCGIPPGRHELTLVPIGYLTLNAVEFGVSHRPEMRRMTGIPSIAVSRKSGRLWATWYAGETKGEDSNNYCVLATSADGGRTWKEVLYVDPDGSGPRRAFDPEVWISPDGKLRWFWTERIAPLELETKVRNSGCLADPRNDELMMMTLDAEAEPKPGAVSATKIGRGVMMCKPTVLRDGRWLLPVAHWQEDPSGCFLSTRDGRTFESAGGIRVPKALRQYEEHQCVERKDGSLLCYLRGKSGLLRSESADGGRTWSVASSFDVRHTASRFFLRRLASGRMLLVKHGPIGEDVGRRQLTAFLSEDEGRTWKGGLELDVRSGASYPDGDQAADGTIFVTYDFGRTKEQMVHFAAFTEADVLAGKDVSGRVRLRQVISAPMDKKRTKGEK